MFFLRKELTAKEFLHGLTQFDDQLVKDVGCETLIPQVNVMRVCKGFDLFFRMLIKISYKVMVMVVSHRCVLACSNVNLT